MLCAFVHLTMAIAHASLHGFQSTFLTKALATSFAQGISEVANFLGLLDSGLYLSCHWSQSSTFWSSLLSNVGSISVSKLLTSFVHITIKLI